MSDPSNRPSAQIGFVGRRSLRHTALFPGHGRQLAQTAPGNICSVIAVAQLTLAEGRLDDGVGDLSLGRVLSEALQGVFRRTMSFGVCIRTLNVALTSRFWPSNSRSYDAR